MLPPGHAAISLGIGVVIWAFTRSTYAVVTALLVGVLVDLDHLIDYYRWLLKEDRRRVWVFLHGYELGVPGFLAAYLSGWNPLVLAGTLAFLGHMLTDQFTNHVRPLTYFLTYRAMKGFRRLEVVDWEEKFLYEAFLRFPGVAAVVYRLNPRLRPKE